MNRFSICLLLLAVAVSGCANKAKARAKAHAAYVAGKVAAFNEMQEARRTSIRILGSVRNPEVPWADGLTLAQVIVAADYTGLRDPSEIVITRQREQVVVDLKALLRGDDVPLEPGDTVELRP